jgi:hypothetical protein
MRLIGRLLSVDELSMQHRAQMLALMDGHYANVCPRRFATDLEEKDWVITVWNREGKLCGFSTQVLVDVSSRNEKVRVLFSGDTIVDRQHWGDPALSHVWGRLALDLVDSADAVNLVWFLLSQGFRTYRFLPLFFREFYPRFDCEMPLWAQDLIGRVAESRYGSLFDRKQGIVRSGDEQYCLREELAEISTSRLQDPHIRFFQRSNPEYYRGDELCCVAPLTRRNFTKAAWRVINVDSPRQEQSHDDRILAE